ncbi:MAG: RNA-dependent DNA polymerase [Chloroflexi bacterium]|nr:RNA-dependent DNA polymerase [Chloroflexota bacterium]
MKTFKHLYPQITAFENLRIAFKRAARGKRKHPNVAAFEYQLERNLLELERELEAQTYRPGAYHNFMIDDPKPRLISAAPFRDRVVHHALCQIIEPLFERRFIHDSYACRVGKGTHAALDRAQAYARQFPYVLQCDLQHFFPMMDHARLRAQLARVIADKQTLWLADQILDSGALIHADDPPCYFEGDDLFAAARPHGLPIGNLTSQFWANVYLNPLDQFCKRELKCAGYVRYVDDFLLFAPDKFTLHAWRARVIEFAATLRQTLHEERAAVFPTATGIPFLGWRVYPDHRRLKRRNGIAFQRRWARLRKEYAAGKIERDRLDAAINGWVAHVAHGDTWGLRRALLSRVAVPRQASA